jgi:amino acid adenylation domain-containing protein
MASQLAYWRERLADIPQLHALPLDQPRPKVQSFAAVAHLQQLSGLNVTKIRQLSQQHNTTLFILLQTTFALWVGRYSNESDVVISSAVAGRSASQLQNLIGFFVNNHVIRTRLDADLSFTELLRQSSANIVDDQQQLDLPFDVLVNALNPTRSASYNPLVQLRFSLDNHINEAPESAIAVAADDSVFSQNSVTTSRFDLALHVTNKGDEIDLQWVANPTLFGLATLNKFAESFQLLLQNVLANPEQSIAKVDFITAQDQQLITQYGQAATLEYPTDLCLQQHFEQHVAKTPAAIALVCEGESFSYQQIDAQANRLAHRLMALMPNSDNKPLIGLMLERSVSAMVAILAVFKAGAAYVPIDPSYPRQRFNYMIEDAAIEILLTHQHQSSLVDTVHNIVIDSAEYQRQAAQYDHTTPVLNKAQADPESLALVIYTSGSTGQPKGVELSHAGVLAYCYSGISDYCFEGIQGSLVMTSLSFGVTVPCLFIPLLTGNKVEMLGQAQSFDAMWTRILSCLENRLLRMTPSHVRTLSALSSMAKPSLVKPSLLNHSFVIGGDQFNRADLALLRQYFPNANIYNHYGCTEVIVGCSLFDTAEVDINSATVAGFIPIGKPLKNVTLRVLDKHQQPLPIGVVGELTVYRDRLAMGYLNHPKFLVNPLGFNTGDLVKYNQSGDLCYVGRRDNQVKIRGFRIELGEIEHSLNALDQVSESVVVVKEKPSGDKQLLAYVVASANTQVIRQQLAQTLPDYMLPSEIITLDKLPLTPNGKLDRQALPQPADSIQQDTVNYVAPIDVMQSQLCDWFQAILEVEQVGINDNFFELGGHSLLAVKLMAQIEATFAVNIPVRILFEANTVAALAVEIEQREGNAQEKNSPVKISARYQLEVDQPDCEEIEL